VDDSRGRLLTTKKSKTTFAGYKFFPSKGIYIGE
jgi:hypothetical protein